MENRHAILPRWIRLRDAPIYLGMDKNRFNREVRPYLTSIPIGTQGIAFDRLEMDKFAEYYMSSNGVPGKPIGDIASWDSDDDELPVSSAKRRERYGISIKSSKDSAFVKALEQLTSLRQNDS